MSFMLFNKTHDINYKKQQFYADLLQLSLDLTGLN